MIKKTPKNNPKLFVEYFKQKNWENEKIKDALKIKFKEISNDQIDEIFESFEIKNDLMSLTEKLKKEVMDDAEKVVKKAKEKKLTDNQIIKLLKKDYKSLSTIDILTLMEKQTGIPVSGNIIDFHENYSFQSEKNLIFVPHEEGKNYFIEGLLNYEFLSLMEKKEHMKFAKKCSLCDSEEHDAENCDQLEEMCETHEPRIVKWCIDIKEKINPCFSNIEVYDFLQEMSKQKKKQIEKYFYFKEEKYSISEITNILKEHLENYKPKNVFGEIKGKVYEVIDENYPENCQYINVNKLKLKGEK